MNFDDFAGPFKTLQHTKEHMLNLCGEGDILIVEVQGEYWANDNFNVDAGGEYDTSTLNGNNFFVLFIEEEDE